MRVSRFRGGYCEAYPRYTRRRWKHGRRGRQGALHMLRTGNEFRTEHAKLEKRGGNGTENELDERKINKEVLISSERGGGTIIAKLRRIKGEIVR